MKIGQAALAKLSIIFNSIYESSLLSRRTVTSPLKVTLRDAHENSRTAIPSHADALKFSGRITGRLGNNSLQVQILNSFMDTYLC